MLKILIIDSKYPFTLKIAFKIKTIVKIIINILVKSHNCKKGLQSHSEKLKLLSFIFVITGWNKARSQTNNLLKKTEIENTEPIITKILEEKKEIFFIKSKKLKKLKINIAINHKENK